MTPQLRLVKVLVQPVFVLDDGENVTEVQHPPVAIPASEWPTYSHQRFPTELKAWQRQIDAEHAQRNSGRRQHPEIIKT